MESQEESPHGPWIGHAHDVSTTVFPFLTPHSNADLGLRGKSQRVVNSPHRAGGSAINLKNHIVGCKPARASGEPGGRRNTTTPRRASGALNRLRDSGSKGAHTHSSQGLVFTGRGEDRANVSASGNSAKGSRIVRVGPLRHTSSVASQPTRHLAALQQLSAASPRPAQTEWPSRNSNLWPEPSAHLQNFPDTLAPGWCNG